MVRINNAMMMTKYSSSQMISTVYVSAAALPQILGCIPSSPLYWNLPYYTKILHRNIVPLPKIDLDR
jgi:hypothetical protein